jgi:sulfide dehydrogenase cytochrome subunit
MHLPLTIALPAAVFAAVVIATAGFAQPTTQLLADSCAACHGTDGNSPGSIDEIDDMDLAEFVEEMREFKYQPGKGRIMGPIARGISDAQIDALAAHFQSMKR